ncbi:MAG: hypothetical protein ACYSW3_01985 [Planctomycetota bacterium]|jgi:hypothetical protein
MKQTKNLISFTLGIIATAILLWFAFEIALPQQPLQGKGNCGEGAVAKDEDPPFKYSGSQDICKVKIKAGEACYGFSYPPASQSDGCYNVKGLGSSNVSVGGGGTSEDCKEISHVEFYACPDSPPTSTNTLRAPDTDTPTPTEPQATATETSTESPTSTGTVTPEQSPTVTTTVQITETPADTPTGTITVTPGDTPDNTPTQTVTVTPPDTLPPPPKQKTGTPEVLLPDTGIDGRSIDENGSWLGIALLLFVLFIAMVFLVRRRK